MYIEEITRIACTVKFNLYFLMHSKASKAFLNVFIDVNKPPDKKKISLVIAATYSGFGRYSHHLLTGT